MHKATLCHCSGIDNVIVGDADAVTKITFNAASERRQLFSGYFFRRRRDDCALTIFDKELASRLPVSPQSPAPGQGQNAKRRRPTFPATAFRRPGRATRQPRCRRTAGLATAPNAMPCADKATRQTARPFPTAHLSACHRSAGHVRDFRCGPNSSASVNAARSCLVIFQPHHFVSAHGVTVTRPRQCFRITARPRYR